MADSTSKKYDLELDDFIINTLSKKNIGYRHLHRAVEEEYRRISFETFDRHINWLIVCGLITKDDKYAPYYLTEKCKQQLRLGTLILVSPRPKTTKPSTLTQLAIKKIHIHILLLLFKFDSSYEFGAIGELEYFLSRFGLSTRSLLFRSANDILHKSSNEIYKLKWVVESKDGIFSVNKRIYIRSPSRANSVSYTCNFKGIKFPIDRSRSDLFRKMDITQDEVKNTLLLFCDENILEKSVEYFGDSIYLAANIRLYDLLSLYSMLYSIARSTLKNIWNLREPRSEEIRWLRMFEGDSKVTRIIIRAKEKRKKRAYYERTRRLTNLIKKINYTTILNKMSQDKRYPSEYESTTKHWIEKEYEEILSNPKYQFIISEIDKFAFPNWFQRIKKKTN
jgi:hypothetical protein